jgi:hypothetical protein
MNQQSQGTEILPEKTLNPVGRPYVLTELLKTRDGG